MSESPAPAAVPRGDVSSLQFRVERFAEPHLPLVAAFSEAYWSRPRTQAFYRWRYLDSMPFSRLFLARTDDQVLGMTCALRKPYLVDGTRSECLEIFDWHSLPGLKGSGVGIRVMRAMMREGLRLVGTGGTPDVLKTLPALGWQQLGTALNFELPIAGAALEPGLRARLGFRVPGARLLLDAVAAAWFRPRRRAFDGRVVPVSTIGEEVEALYRGETGYDVLQVPDRAQLHWMTGGYAGTGSFRYWYFVVHERLRGWALTRVYDTEQGREAAIVDVFAPGADARIYAWMVSELASALAGEAPLLIRGRASCPHLRAAFLMNRFREAGGIPIFTWPKIPREGLRLHITLNHTDAPLRPYPSSDPFVSEA